MSIRSRVRLCLLWVAAPLAGLFGLAGCASWTPKLVAAGVDAIPPPTGLRNTALWDRADPLTLTVSRGAGRLRDTRQVQLQAITDGRMLAIQAVWRDGLQNSEPQVWVWNPQSERYRLEQHEADRFAIEWPLTPDADFHPLEARPASYDVWLWDAGWTAMSGHAADERLDVEVYPAQTAADAVDVPLFPTPDRRSKIANRWTPDPGDSSVYPVPQPRHHQADRMPGVLAHEPTGSAADVRVRAIYNKFSTSRPNAWFSAGGHRTPGAWFGNERVRDEEGYWLVEFQRLLTTADKQSDYQIIGLGPHRFAIAISDGEPWTVRYLSGPIRLTLER